MKEPVMQQKTREHRVGAEQVHQDTEESLFTRIIALQSSWLAHWPREPLQPAQQLSCTSVGTEWAHQDSEHGWCTRSAGGPIARWPAWGDPSCLKWQHQVASGGVSKCDLQERQHLGLQHKGWGFSIVSFPAEPAGSLLTPVPIFPLLIGWGQLTCSF